VSAATSTRRAIALDLAWNEIGLLEHILREWLGGGFSVSGPAVNLAESIIAELVERRQLLDTPRPKA
jgi:hypothetical protein